MKKYFNFFSLVFLFCTLEAVRIEFEAGTRLDVPDSIIIHNDLGKDFMVYEVDVDPKYTLSGFILYALPKSRTLKLVDMSPDISVKVYEKHGKQRQYTLYPTTGVAQSGRAVMGLTTVFEYDLSDIVKRNKNALGGTIIKRIREYSEETTTLSINKNV
ncbi:hypothetical protein BH09DEP1_BH09DEP1_0830 [soil metagenome]